MPESDAESEAPVLSQRLIAAHDEERRRLSRELHDHLNQHLALLAIELQQLGANPGVSPDALAAALQDLWRQTTEISSEVNALSHRLHPTKLEALGFPTTARGHCRDISRQGVTVHFSSDAIGPGQVPSDVGLCLFRVLEEAVSNAVGHSGATQVSVTLEAGDRDLVLRVSDAGRGFDPADQRATEGLGLAIMRLRVRALGGTLNIASSPGGGTIIQARLARSASARAAAAAPLVDAARTPPVARTAG